MFNFNMFEITEAMINYGGSFAKSLAVCYRTADLVNQDKLVDTFSDLFHQYDNLLIVKAKKELLTNAIRIQST